MKDKKHYIWIDALRGVGILFVILGHLNSPLRRYIFAFHMPLFFLISGYLHNPNLAAGGAKSAACKYIYKYIIPYYILCTLNLLIEFILSCLGLSSYNFNLKRYAFGIIYSRSGLEFMPNCSPLWYLTCIFCALLLFDFLMNLRSKSLKIFGFICCFLLATLIDVIDIQKLPWNLDTAFMGCIFLGIGYIARKTFILEKFTRTSVSFKAIILIFLIFLGIYCVQLNPIELVSFAEVEYGNVFLMILGAASISAIFFILAYRFFTTRNVMTNLLSFFGNHTIFIMAFEYVSGSISSKLLFELGILSWPLLFILKCIILSIGIIIWDHIVQMLPGGKIKTLLTF